MISSVPIHLSIYSPNGVFQYQLTLLFYVIFFTWLILYANFQLTKTPLTFAVVNLTLIDLPGLTKVAVGKYQAGHVFLVLGFVTTLSELLNYCSGGLEMESDMLTTDGFAKYRGSTRQYCP